ncbi:MAG TPA: hypothetical protein VHZ53_13675 [Steroidobacteraceae bacterium]|jgi:hypothetical protein|nr:hypothetical protein [Steroidobacteraceae bacterium]
MASARLSQSIRAWIIGVGAGAWATGAGWLVAHYLLKARDQFGLDSNPQEPWWLRVHGAFAFLAIWTGGILWGLHIVNAWGQRRRRWSGGALFGIVVIVVLTGYLLYYVGADRVRAGISIVHWGLGLALPAAYFAHRLLHRLSRR